MYGMFRSTYVQTYLTQWLTRSLSAELNTTIKIEGVDLDFFKSLVLEGVYIEDLHQDTLLYLSKLKISLSSFDGEHKHLALDEVEISKGLLSIRKFENEEEHNFKFIIDSLFNKNADNPVWQIECRSIEVKDIRFRYRNENDSSIVQGINYQDLSIKEINTVIQDFSMVDDTIIGDIRVFRCIEDRGFILENFSGHVKTSPKELQINNLWISTPESNVYTDLRFNYSEYNSYLHFNDSVYMYYNFSPSILSLSDLAIFTNFFRGLKEDVKLNGVIKGPVSRLKGKNIELQYGLRSEFKGDFTLAGLPDLEETFMQFRVKKFETTQMDIASMILPPFSEGKKVNVPYFIASMGDMKFKGDFTGFYYDFVAYGRFYTGLGNLSSDLLLKRDAMTNTIKYAGALSSHSFDVGKMLGVADYVGRAEFDLNIRGDGLGKGTAKAHLDGLISGIDINNYYYRNIELKGDLANRRFKGSLEVKEENLDFVFNGEIDNSRSPALFNFYSSVNEAKLAKLNFVTTIPNPIFSINMASNFSGDDIDNMEGDIVLSNIKYRDDKLEKGLEHYPIGDIAIKAIEKEKDRHISLKSDFLKADINGEFNFGELPASLVSLFDKIFPNSEHVADLRAAFGLSGVPQDFSFSFDVIDGTKLLPIIYPELIIADESEAYGHFNTEKNDLQINFISKYVKHKDLEMSGINWSSGVKEVSNDSATIDLELITSSAFKKVSLEKNLLIENLEIEVAGMDNQIRFISEWDNRKTPHNEGVISGLLNFELEEGQQQIRITIDSTALTISDSVWVIRGENTIKYYPDYLSVKNLRVNNSIQSFEVNGSSSTNPDLEEGINVVLDNFDISALNILQKDKDLAFDGVANGNAEFYGLFDELHATGRLKINDLSINNKLYGSLSLVSKWMRGHKSIDLVGSLARDQFTLVDFSGTYNIDTSDANASSGLDISLALNQFKLEVFEPFVSRVFSSIAPRSSASGKLHLTGTLKAPVLTGKVLVQKAGFTIGYLNTKYTFTNEFVFTKDKISFNNLTLNDMKGNTGLVSGRINHENFHNIAFDIKIKQNNLHSLNTRVVDNNYYYGQAYGSGDIHISGPLGAMDIVVNSTSGVGTQVNIPLSNSEELASNAYVVFINGKDTNDYENVTANNKKEEIGMPQVKINLEVSDNAKVQLIFDEMIGDVLKAKGKGNLQLDVGKDGEFNIFGTYTITEGDYLFTLQKIINKRFKIEKGSTITWTGDPYSANIDIKALYSLNASLYNLTLDEQNKGRIPVACILKMKGSLMKPEIAFDINFPGLEEGMQSSVQWLLNTEEEINKQMFSLLILGQFQPWDNSLVSASGGVGANSTELLSNQLSNWLSRISEDFDIGINYRPGDEITREEVEVALSTQLFDGRLIVNGSVANNSAATSQNPSNIVGDFMLEYLIAKESDVRLKVYNRSNDSYLTTNYSPYTQGVGISFKKEFNKFRDLFGKTGKMENDLEIND
ncbi:MAG TPA: translocation/assembly module TamB [Flavobacteriales bacterium]|nr:translocation/assembly module TamB [Flavobacteriales bacterium]